MGLSTNFDLCQQWMKECDSHENCSASQDAPQLPTRLIDTGPENSACCPTLINTSDSDDATRKGLRYACLSWCWGKVPPLVITKNQQHMPPFEGLPATFRDTLTVSRELQLRYIWIDALCIIQDDLEDWQKECARMADIYRNGAVTIAARDSADCTAGFLERANPIGLQC